MRNVGLTLFVLIMLQRIVRASSAVVRFLMSLRARLTPHNSVALEYLSWSYAVTFRHHSCRRTSPSRVGTVIIWTSFVTAWRVFLKQVSVLPGDFRDYEVWGFHCDEDSSRGLPCNIVVGYQLDASIFRLNIVVGYQHFVGPSCLHLQGEDFGRIPTIRITLPRPYSGRWRKAARSFETLISYHITIRRHDAEDPDLNPLT